MNKPGEEGAGIRPRLFSMSWCSALAILSNSAAAQTGPAGPPGYTGAINTPTADVMIPGTVSYTITDSVPETRPQYPGVGFFGSLNLGFGLLPGLEAFGRLASGGDTECDLYRQKSAICKSDFRDLSVSAKYQLPFRRLPFDTRFALGFNDFGGAATLFRQTYGVVTSSMGPLDLSLGYSRATPGQDSGGLMDGIFGNASLYLTNDIKLMLEDDTRERRLGAAYQWQMLEDWSLALGVSQKLTDNSGQQKSQITLTLSQDLDGEARRFAGGQPLKPRGRFTFPPLFEQETPLPDLEQLKYVVAKPDAQMAVASLGAKAKHIAERLAAQGFSDIWVGRRGEGWHIQAEPRQWRKNRLDALGVALATWVKLRLDQNEPVTFTLTYLENPVLQATTTGMCVLEFLDGRELCGLQEAVGLTDNPMAMKADLGMVEWHVQDSTDSWLRPNFELGPAASYTAGTEYGLFDYSIGLQTAWEIPLAKGLSFQGLHNDLIKDSDDFSGNASYFRRLGLGVKSGLGANLLVYTRPLYNRLWLEASTGSQSSSIKGENLSLSWTTPNGFLRFNAVAGNFNLDVPGSTGGIIFLGEPVITSRVEKLEPRLFVTRVNLIPGRWRLLYTQGTFLNGDPGFLITSSHFFGDTRINFFYRKTGPGNFRTPYERQFAGFAVSFPLGPKQSWSVGPVTVRGRDRFVMGLETKVGDSDNYIELHYGISPGARYGLFSDVLDHDRADTGSLKANRYRLRAMLRQQFAKN
ncbi:MAG: YjbH domain-containing protein [Burkholderiaceae bacterium]|nr:YjbH domain-containing protein [Burkholderiaceae bacterium]